MDGITIVDLSILIIILLSGTLAYFRGFIRETLSISGWITAAIVAFKFAPNLDPTLRSIPYLGDLLKKSCEISIITSFILLFTISLVIFSLLVTFFSSFVKKTFIKSIDRGLGFLFGLSRGALIIIILFITYDNFYKTHSQEVEFIERSVSQKILGLYKEQINEFMPKGLLNSTFTRYEELILNCKLYN
jgi:membrane protein required for colicin V production